jgi:hypothetical protein
MSGGDPTAIHAAQHAAPLRMRAVSRITQNAAGSHAPGGQDGGGFSSPVAPAVRRFWQRVNSGAVRLSRFEDGFVWQMRGAGLTFDEIGAALVERRADKAVKNGKGGARRWVLKWREDYRRERGL